MGDACEVAGEDDEQEDYAFACGGSRDIGAVNARGPGRAKTDQHDRFEDTHSD